MPSLELSPILMNMVLGTNTTATSSSITCRTLGITTSGSVTAATSANGASAIVGYRPLIDYPTTANRSVTQLNIMKGTVPTDFSSLVDYTSRSADILITYATTASGSNNFAFGVDVGTASSTFYDYSEVALSTNYVAATAAGTATWFWMYARACTAANTFSNTLYHQVFGTIGTIGSGSDLEIPSVSIEQAKLYKVKGLTLAIPSLYSY